MFTKTQIALSAAIVLGTASIAPAMTKLPIRGQAGPPIWSRANERVWKR